MSLHARGMSSLCLPGQTSQASQAEADATKKAKARILDITVNELSNEGSALVRQVGHGNHRGEFLNTAAQ
jgi:hypothetical protein